MAVGYWLAGGVDVAVTLPKQKRGTSPGRADIKTTRRYAQSDLEQRRAALEGLAD